MEFCYCGTTKPEPTKPKSKIIKFTPPKKVNYVLKELNEGPQRKNITKCKFVHSLYDAQYPWIKYNAYWLTKPNKKKIVALHISNSNKKEPSATFLLSHGSSVDLSTIFPQLIDFSSILKVDLISFDFSGYGLSEDACTEANLLDDLIEVVDFTKDELKVDLKRLFLIGQSLGTVPILQLLANNKYPSISSAILISPISGGVCFKGSQSIETTFSTMIREVTCPLFIIHGLKDEVISHKFSMEAAKRVRCLYHWYPRHGDHSNIMKLYRNKFYTRIRFFIDNVNYSQQKRLIHKSEVVRFLGTENPFIVDNYTEKEFISASVRVRCGQRSEEVFDNKLEEIKSEEAVSERSSQAGRKGNSINNGFIDVSPGLFAQRTSSKNLGVTNFASGSEVDLRFSNVNVNLADDINTEFEEMKKKNGLI